MLSDPEPEPGSHHPAPEPPSHGSPNSRTDVGSDRASNRRAHDSANPASHESPKSASNPPPYQPPDSPPKFSSNSDSKSDSDSTSHGYTNEATLTSPDLGSHFLALAAPDSTSVPWL